MTLSRMHIVVEQPYHSDSDYAAVHAFLQLRDPALFHEILTPESTRTVCMFLLEVKCICTASSASQGVHKGQLGSGVNPTRKPLWVQPSMRREEVALDRTPSSGDQATIR
jgi:hypothetical protein